MSLRAYVSGALVAALAVGCVSANKQAVEHRNKGRVRFAEGKYDLAVANYRQAKTEDKGGKIEGLEAERERAASEQVRKLLVDAWGKFDRGEFQQAHALLVVIKNASELSNKITDPQVVRSLGDTAAMAWDEVEALKKRRFYLRAMLLAEYLVKPLPVGHAMRVRHDALKVSAIGFHMAKMRALKPTAPNAAAFHYLVAKRLGGDTDVDGLELIAAVKRASGDASTYNSAGKSASGDKAEDNYVLGRQLGSTWDPAAITHYGTAYGMNDARYLDEVWNGTATLEPYPAAAAITLPAPDDVQVSVVVDPSPDAGPRYKSLDFYYQIGAHTLEAKTLSTGAGGAYRFPSKSGKMTYELSGFFESATLGGDTKGYGGDLLITALAKAPLVLGAGIGYLKDELPSEMLPGMTISQKSVHVPIVARAALGAGYAASLEARINILQFSEDKKPIPEEQHYSPVSLRMYGPIPLLGDAVPALRALQIEGYATYTKDAPQEATYGGRLVYRSVLDGSGGSGKDLWDKIEKSAFAIQTLAGPTWDFWFDVSTTPLSKDDKSHGMGTLFRIPNKDSGSVYEFGLHFESSNLGGNVGGWGIDYILMKPVKKFGVLGFGLGYASGSISEAPEMTVPDPTYKAPEHNSFHSPIVLRIPLGTSAILGLEGRLNYLALGGTGDPAMNEKRHFHYVGGRLWIPLPLLGDAISALSKFHLEGHLGYTPEGVRELNYGGMLIWRPIVTTKM